MKQNLFRTTLLIYLIFTGKFLFGQISRVNDFRIFNEKQLQSAQSQISKNFFDSTEYVPHMYEFLGYFDEENKDFAIEVKNFDVKSDYVFSFIIVEHPILYKDIKFENLSKIEYSHFVYFTKFENVKFRDISFKGTKFYEKLKFDNCTLGKTIFNDSGFGKKLLIINSTLTGEISFDGAIMPDTLYLQNNKIQTDLDFTRVSDFIGVEADSSSDEQFEYFDKKCVIFLVSGNYADLSRIILPSDRFTLGFRGDERFEVKASCYEQIIKKCTDLGLTDSVRGWTIEYEQMKNINKYGDFWGSIWNEIQDKWWGFGFEKQRIIYSTFIIFLILLTINTFFLFPLIQNVYYDPDLSKNFLPKGTDSAKKLIHCLESDKWYKTMYNKFTYSIQLTGIIYFGLKVNHEALNNKTLGLFYFYIIYLTGVFHLAGIITFILHIDPL